MTSDDVASAMVVAGYRAECLDSPTVEPTYLTLRDRWAFKVLRAELRRYQAMRCETCKHRNHPYAANVYDECLRTISDADTGDRTWCHVLGGGCLAWERRDA